MELVRIELLYLYPYTQLMSRSYYGFWVVGLDQVVQTRHAIEPGGAVRLLNKELLRVLLPFDIRNACATLSWTCIITSELKLSQVMVFRQMTSMSMHQNSGPSPHQIVLS